MINADVLMMSSFFSLLILIIVGFILYYKFPEKKYFKYFALFPTFFLTGEILRTLRVYISDFFSVIIANTLMVFGIIFLYIGVRAILNFEAKWNNRYYIPVSIVFFGFLLFTYIYYDIAMRILIFSTFTIIYASAIAWRFLKYPTKEYKVLDYISGVLFLVGILIFFARAFKASMIEINMNYPKSSEILNSFIYAYLFFMTAWLNIILIVRARDLFKNKKSRDSLNKEIL